MYTRNDRASLLFALALFLLYAVQLTASTPAGYYRGSIGADSVSACFSTEQDEYYAEQDAKTVWLMEFEDKPNSYLESDPSHMRFPEDFDPTIDAWWEIEINEKDGEIRGIRKTGGPEGIRETPIILRRQQADCTGYESHRLDLPFSPGNTEQVHGITLQTSSHPVTGVGFLQITSGIPTEAMSTINKTLLQYAQEGNETWTECSDWTSSQTAAFVSPLWIVISTDSGGYCGGPHPGEDSLVTAFDAATGRRIDFREWIDPEFWSSGKIQGKLRDALLPELTEAGCTDRHGEGDWEEFSPWMGEDAFLFRLDQTDRYYVSCEGDYGVSFDAMRAFIAESYLKTYDRFVAEATRMAQHEPAVRKD